MLRSSPNRFAVAEDMLPARPNMLQTRPNNVATSPTSCYSLAQVMLLFQPTRTKTQSCIPTSVWCIVSAPIYRGAAIAEARQTRVERVAVSRQMNQARAAPGRLSNHTCAAGKQPRPERSGQHAQHAGHVNFQRLVGHIRRRLEETCRLPRCFALTSPAHLRTDGVDSTFGGQHWPLALDASGGHGPLALDAPGSLCPLIHPNETPCAKFAVASSK